MINKFTLLNYIMVFFRSNEALLFVWRTDQFKHSVFYLNYISSRGEEQQICEYELFIRLFK